MIWLLWIVPLAPLALMAWVIVDPRPHRGPLLASAAAVPALVAAFAGGATPVFSWLLFGARLEVDETARVFLVLTSLLWIAGSLVTHGYLGDEGRRRFTVFWLLTMSGNLGLVVAADVATFYLAFVVMTFAAYGLIAHDRTAEALRAGRIYMIMSVLGEAALIAGLIAATWTANGELHPAAIRAGVATAEYRELIIGLLVIGFGVKAGLAFVHMWLPLAHPAAPTPASAVLSGAMIKAGLIGWLSFLPLAEAEVETWGSVLVALGLIAAFFAVLAGLPHRDPKVVLAYSSVSQMGIMTVIVGVALQASGGVAALITAVTVFALHHGLAKGALFVGVAVLPRVSGRARILVLAALVAMALAIAGAPLTSGMIAKGLAKEAFDATGGPASIVLSLTSIGTTVLLVRALHLLRTAERTHDRPGAWLATGFGALVLAALLLVWLLPASWLASAEVGETLYPGGLWDATWPVLAGLGVAAAGATLVRRALLRPPEVPPGDLLAVEEWSALMARRGWTHVITPRAIRIGTSTWRWGRRLSALALVGDTLERWMANWMVAGTLFVTLMTVLALLSIR